METGFISIIVLLTALVLLAVFDGFYLHLCKYQLFNHPESKNEHLIHTVRAVLFPAIVYFLFIKQDCTTCFWIGIILVVADIIISGVDAYMENDSRKFMGGLPRWEYIVHLFANGFHFAAIAVFLVLKIQVTSGSLSLVSNFESYSNFRLFEFLMISLLPGAIILALIHLMLSIPVTLQLWNDTRKKITCC